MITDILHQFVLSLRRLIKKYLIKALIKHSHATALTHQVNNPELADIAQYCA